MISKAFKKDKNDRSNIALNLHYQNIANMCYFHTHSHVMITFVFKIVNILSVIILYIYVLDSEISKFQIYVGKLS